MTTKDVIIHKVYWLVVLIIKNDEFEAKASLRTGTALGRFVMQKIESLKHPYYFVRIFKGDWMMGPSRFCSESICKIGIDLHYHFNSKSWSWQPSTYNDVSYIVEQLRGYKPMFQQYISNMKYGIAAGMTRSTEQCEAGYYSFLGSFKKISALGEKGW